MIDTGNQSPTASLWDLATRLQRCCEAQAESIRLETRLSPAELTLLRAFPSGEAIAGSQLAHAAELSVSRCSRVVDRLVRRGLVERDESSADRRVSLLRLSRAGQKSKATIADCLSRCDERIRTQLTPSEAIQTEAALARLVRALEPT